MLRLHEDVGTFVTGNGLLKPDIIVFPMRVFRLVLSASMAATVALTAWAQDGSSLPSAPSATLEQQRPPAPPPQSAQQPQTQAQQPKTEDPKPQQPVLETLDPKLRPRVQPANGAPQSESAAQAQTPPSPNKNEAEGSQDKPFNTIAIRHSSLDSTPLPRSLRTSLTIRKSSQPAFACYVLAAAQRFMTRCMGHVTTS